MKSVYILNGARTPFTNFGGSLKDITDIDLGVVASKEAMERSGVRPNQIDHVIFGNVIHTSKASSYFARHIGLKSGVPEEVPALTVNRLCGSGLQSVVSGIQAILTGDAEVVLAGGAENMSQSPHVLRQTRFGSKMTAPPIDDMLWDTLTDQYIGYGMGLTAEALADDYKITRAEQDQFALQSQEKANIAKAQGVFNEEIVPVSIRSKKGEKVVSEDEYIRTDATYDILQSLKPAFKKDGTVTAGNASGINDGAAAVIIASDTFVQENKSLPLAKIVSWGIAGVDPAKMGLGPVPASKIALEKASLSIEDIDLFEINEAFAAQYLAVEKELKLDREKVNRYGGAIALGHPVGASGARILYSLALQLKRENKKFGLASLCIGGGQGISVIIEAV